MAYGGVTPVIVSKYHHVAHMLVRVMKQIALTNLRLLAA